MPLDHPVLLVPLLLALGLWAYSLVDFTRTDERDIRLYPRQVWILILVFTSIFGSLLWLMYGRGPRPSRR
jgi:hypothetical protein